MALSADNLHLRLSGGSGNASALASIGGAASTATDAPPELFRGITDPERVSGVTLYRCVYLRNTSVSDSAPVGKVWIASDTTSGDTLIAIGLGAAAVDAAETAVADEQTAPPGVSFTSPTTKESGLVTPTLLAGQVKALWIRLGVSALAAELPIDAWTLRWGFGDSALPSLDFSQPSNSMYVWMI